MDDRFDLSVDELTDMAMDLYRKIRLGFEDTDAEIRCLPAFIAPPEGPLNGNVAVIDLGGSNLRVAVVSIKEGEASVTDGPLAMEMPWQRNVPFPKAQFLSIQADMIAALNTEKADALGYCFSYPAESLRSRDARLLRWTKGIIVGDTEGRPVGEMLHSYLTERRIGPFRSVTVVNDTIAALFAGTQTPGPDGHIGLIMGTGSNMAAFFTAGHIPKLRHVPWKGKIPVNLESGNFNPPHLTRWDHILDGRSENPGAQRFEKAVSGMYLGRIFKSVFPKSLFDPETGARGLADLIDRQADTDTAQVATARRLYDRSARMTAASLAGLIRMLSDQQILKRVRIVAEGGLIRSRIDKKIFFLSRVEETLRLLLNELDLIDIDVEFVRTENATLIGTAIAALA